MPGFAIQVDRNCPYLDMENLVCRFDETKDKKYRATPKCITCRIALYELWKERQKSLKPSAGGRMEFIRLE